MCGTQWTDSMAQGPSGEPFAETARLMQQSPSYDMQSSERFGSAVGGKDLFGIPSGLPVPQAAPAPAAPVAPGAGSGTNTALQQKPKARVADTTGSYGPTATGLASGGGTGIKM